jgi:hypothetical protein
LSKVSGLSKMWTWASNIPDFVEKVISSNMAAAPQTDFEFQEKVQFFKDCKWHKKY